MTRLDAIDAAAPDARGSLLQVLTGILSRPVPAATRARAALHVIDWIGCAVLGARSPAGERMRHYGRQLGAGPCRAIGVGGLDAPAAALVNGAYGNVLEMDDIHRTSILHPGPVVVPAALAVALREQARSDDFLDALVRGYEAMIRIGRSVGPGHYKHWHNTSTCGPFGAAAAAGSLLSLTPEQMVWALGNAGTQAAGPWQCRLEGTMSKQLHNARAAHAGVVAADLARLGFTGPAQMLEGRLGFYAAMCPDPTPQAVVADVDADWLIGATSFKPWPACRHTHAMIDAMLVARERVAVEEVAEIVVRTHADAITICDNPVPKTGLEGKFSLQHCAAVVLHDGAPALEAFEPPALTSEAIETLRQKVRLEVAEPFASAYPQHYGASVVLRLGDGREITATASDSLGDPENPMDAEAIADKARMLMTAAGVDGGRIEAIVSATRALPDGGSLQALAALFP